MGASALARPRISLASAPSNRRFLFVHARGGWDTTVSLLPAFDAADLDAGSEEAEAGGVTFVDHPDRPAVRSFFEGWGSRCALVHGIEVRSVAHEVCERILLTGNGGAGRDDWPSLIAAHAAGDPVLPYLLIAGSAFNSAYADRVVRVGDEGPPLGADDVLHHEDRIAVVIGAERVNRDDVRVLEAAHGARFAEQARRCRCPDCGLHALDRDVPVQQRLMRAVDLAHPALAELVPQHQLRVGSV